MPCVYESGSYTWWGRRVKAVMANVELVWKEQGRQREKSNKVANSVNCAVVIGILSVHGGDGSESTLPDLAAYMAQIIQASQQFKGTPWQDYDTLFQMQTVAAERPHFAVVDTSLWAITFTNVRPRDII